MMALPNAPPMGPFFPGAWGDRPTQVVEIFALDDPDGLNGPFGKGVVVGASGAGTVESIAYSDYPLTEEGYPAFVPASSFGGGRPG